MLAQGIDVSTNMFHVAFAWHVLVATPTPLPLYPAPFQKQSSYEGTLLIALCVSRNTNENIIIFSLTMYMSKLEALYRFQTLDKS